MEFADKSKNVKKLQKKELEIMKYFDNFCEENNIKYYLAYGTLLGSIRHHGFIPWDDDVDVFVSGEDFLKLKKIFNEKADTDKYFYQTLQNEKNYYLLWDKIRLNNTIFVEKGWENNDINNGIFIDIFPLLDYPDNEKEEKKFVRKYKMLRLLIEANICNNKSRYNNYGKVGKFISKIVKLLSQKTRNEIVIKVIRYFCLYKSNSKYYYSLDSGLNTKFLKESFKDIKRVKFEGMEFCVPSGYHTNLTEIYGEYMKLPPEKDRVGHGEVYLNLGDDNDEYKK